MRESQDDELGRTHGSHADFHDHATFEDIQRIISVHPAEKLTVTVRRGQDTLDLPVLTDSHGLTLYYFLPEKNGAIGACTGGCLTVWPPVVATGTPTSSSGATGTLGTVSVMFNGASVTEVTYNGWPLHTFASDTAAGQTGGNGVMNQWFAAMPGTTSSSTGGTTSGSTPTPTASTNGGGYGY